MTGCKLSPLPPHAQIRWQRRWCEVGRSLEAMWLRVLAIRSSHEKVTVIPGILQKLQPLSKMLVLQLIVQVMHRLYFQTWRIDTHYWFWDQSRGQRSERQGTHDASNRDLGWLRQRNKRLEATSMNPPKNVCCMLDHQRWVFESPAGTYEMKGVPMLSQHQAKRMVVCSPGITYHQPNDSATLMG